MAILGFDLEGFEGIFRDLKKYMATLTTKWKHKWNTCKVDHATQIHDTRQYCRASRERERDKEDSSSPCRLRYHSRKTTETKAEYWEVQLLKTQTKCCKKRKKIIGYYTKLIHTTTILVGPIITINNSIAAFALGNAHATNALEVRGLTGCRRWMRKREGCTAAVRYTWITWDGKYESQTTRKLDRVTMSCRISHAACWDYIWYSVSPSCGMSSIPTNLCDTHTIL